MRKTFIVALLAALVFTVAGLSIAAEMTTDQLDRAADKDVKSSQEHMKQMGMSEGMQMRHKMCMSGKMGTYDPAGLMAIKEDINLTDEQIARLQSINDRAQQDAKAVLTAEQQTKMQQVEGTPDTAAGMHKQASEKMGGQCPLMGGETGTGTMRDSGTRGTTTGTGSMSGTATGTTGMGGTSGTATGTAGRTGTSGTATGTAGRTGTSGTATGTAGSMSGTATGTAGTTR